TSRDQFGRYTIAVENEFTASSGVNIETWACHRRSIRPYCESFQARNDIIGWKCVIAIVGWHFPYIDDPYQVLRCGCRPERNLSVAVNSIVCLLRHHIRSPAIIFTGSGRPLLLEAV